MSAAPKANVLLRERLYDDICAGQFRPGEWLRQIDLEARYDMPRFAVRQVLAELTIAEVLEHVPNRGFRISEPSVEKRIEITEVRLNLEIPASLAAMQHATAEDLDQIEAAAQAYMRALDGRPWAEIRQANHAFHRRLLQPCPNETMRNLVHTLRERNLPGAWQAGPAQLQRSGEDHLRIVQAMRQRDETALRDSIAAHLTAWRAAQT